MLSFVYLIIGNVLCTEKVISKSNQKAMISNFVPFYEDYTIIENLNLKKRTIDEIQKKFKQSFVHPLSACKNPNECKLKYHEKQIILPSIEDHENSLKMVNFIRYLTGLSKGIIEDEEWSEECYKTAVSMQKIKKNFESESNFQFIRNSEIFITENSMTVFNSLIKLITRENVENQVSLFHPNLIKIGFGFYPFREEKINGFISLKPSITVIKFSINYLEDKVILPSNLKFVSWPPEGPFPIEFLQSSWHIRHDDFKKTQINKIKIFIHRDDGFELKAKNISIDTDLLIFQVSKNDLNKCQIMRTIIVKIINQQMKKIYSFSFELFKADRNIYFNLNTKEKDMKNRYLLNSDGNPSEDIKRKSNDDENLFKFLFNSFFMFFAAVLLFIFLGLKNNGNDSENEDSEKEEKEKENVENVENENKKNNSNAENGGNFYNSSQPVVDPISCCYCNLCCIYVDRTCCDGCNCKCCNDCDCKLDCGDCDCNLDDCDCNFCDICNIFF